MTNLNELKVAELQVIAKENGIALSRTIEGKRSRLTKAELIVAIKKADNERMVLVSEAAPTTDETVTNEVTEITTEQVTPATNVADQVTTIETKSDEKEITLLALSEVIPFATNKLKEITCKQELLKFKGKLLATFGDKQQTKKRTLKAKWALQYNRLVMMFKQAELKLQ